MKGLQGIGAALIVTAFAGLGLWLVVIKGLGPDWSLLPGGRVDSGLNLYLLEHFYRWISGTDPRFWTADFYYPYPDTIAFGDNFLGSGPVYAALRSVGLDRASAFQGWYMVGYGLNFLAAAYVLSRMHCAPLGIGLGAFFFAFGLPVLAQENHVQLLYRFGVPLACYSLWESVERPRLPAFGAVVFWLVWQFYLSIYMGVFLALLLGMLFLFAPLGAGQVSASQFGRFWADRARLAWGRARTGARSLAVSAVIFLVAMLVVLLKPYWDVSRLYHFGWAWNYVVSMLPTWSSYLLADRSQLWMPVSALIHDVPNRVEQQLFPGLAAVVLECVGVLGLLRQRVSERGAAVRVHLLAGLSLVALTLLIGGFSLWRILWLLPGIDSLRAVARIILIAIWPAVLLIGYAVDQIAEWQTRFAPLRIGLLATLSALLVLESVLFDHYAYNRVDVGARLRSLRAQLPAVVPAQPILVVHTPAGGGYSEVDAMLLGQDLGWPVMNGYDANFPPGYALTTDSCRSIPERIMLYMQFAGIQGSDYYLGMIRRTVPIGFIDCDPGWWQGMPK